MDYGSKEERALTHEEGAVLKTLQQEVLPKSNIHVSLANANHTATSSLKRAEKSTPSWVKRKKNQIYKVNCTKDLYAPFLLPHGYL